MNPKNSRKKSPIHENAAANISCDFGDGDISRSRSFLSNTIPKARTNERTNERRNGGTDERTNGRTHIVTWTS